MTQSSPNLAWQGATALRPQVSIITANLNAAEGLALTLASLRAQRGTDFEWLVADGGSTDGSGELFAANSDCIRWLSTPDRGLYDAWNRACREARGEWLLFLGAGDELAGPNVLADISKLLMQAMPAHPLVYGRLVYLTPGQRTPLELVGRPWHELSSRWEIGRPALPPHGSTFHHRSLFGDEAPFDIQLRIAADSDFLLRALRLGTPLFAPVTITRAPIGGVSFQMGSQKRLQTEVASINRRHGLHPPIVHTWLNNTVNLIKSIISLLPTRQQARLVDIARRCVGLPKRWTVE